jgi:hypothetical protein
MLLAGHGLKIKTVPIAALPTYFFFSQCTQEMARGVEQFGGGGGRPEQMK